MAFGIEGTMPHSVSQDDYVDFDKRMRLLWAQGMPSDVKVVTLDTTHNVHKEVLIQESDFFAKALTQNWKEAKMNEIEMKHDDPGLIRAMLNYIYFERYEAEDIREEYRNYQYIIPELCDHAEVHAIGMKYMVDGLATYAAAMFDYAWDHADESERVEAVFELVPILYDNIPSDFKLTPPISSDIAKWIADFVADNLVVLLQNVAFRELLVEYPVFNITVLQSCQSLEPQPDYHPPEDASWPVSFW